MTPTPLHAATFGTASAGLVPQCKWEIERALGLGPDRSHALHNGPIGDPTDGARSRRSHRFTCKDGATAETTLPPGGTP